METYIEDFIASVASALENNENDSEAIAAVSAMIGALAISRVITDPKRSDAILRAVKENVIAMKPDNPA